MWTPLHVMVPHEQQSLRMRQKMIITEMFCSAFEPRNICKANELSGSFSGLGEGSSWWFGLHCYCCCSYLMFS